MDITQIFALIACISLLISLFFDPLWDLGTWIYHKICDLFGVCYHPYGKSIKFVEQYLDKDGNELDYDNMSSEEFNKRLDVHHTYRIYYCSKCGKVFETEQLQ